ncbi:MAG: 4a-hydroxytetrahydrobiopterin dehydratase [Burkholderiales bacterium]|nr:4a-hydroxytetrahydrobiopterin dehydratase [Burkholderiales bacterium]GIK88536.1 MAG: putative pterin-4-alpha-carbinolamine dehydratase [Betaproteobacteria bacterium]
MSEATAAVEALARQACARSAARLSDQAIADAVAALPGWSHVADRIAKTFRFAGWHETMAFVNAVAWVAERADHHPDLSVHFNRCVVSYSTHDAGGITQNDLICAARIERLLA